jgi:YtcA family
LNTRATTKYPAIAPLLGMLLLFSGCAVGRGASSFPLLGAFFPGWMFCAGIGILAGIGARTVFVGTGWSTVLPFQLFVCAAIGTIAGLLVWLLWFGR